MKFYFYVGVLCTTLAMAGCEKSFERFEPVDAGGNNDSAWVSADATSLFVNQLHQELLPALAADSFNLQQGTTITTSGNNRVIFPANAFQASGSTATGLALGRFLLLQTKGDYIRIRRTTTSNGYLLQNKAVVYLDVSRNGQSLSVAPNRTLSVVIRTPLNSTGASGFYGTSTANNGFTSYNWIADTSVNVYPDTNGYVMVTGKLQWQSVGRMEDSTVAKSRTVVSMPATFTNANTSVFMVYNNRQSVVQLIPDAANRIWLAEKVPLGEPVVLVTLSKKNDGYWLGMQQVLTTQNQNIRMTAQQSSLPGINAFLNSL